MKKALILLSVIMVGGISILLAGKNHRSPDILVDPSEYRDDIDDRIKGPNGEVIFVGSNGGRYFFRNGRKVYLSLKRKND